MTIETSIFPQPPEHLRAEYKRERELFDAQPGIIQRFIEQQSRHIAEALVGSQPQVKFSLPDRIFAEIPQIAQAADITVPANAREQVVGGLRNRLLGKTAREAIRHRLNELEGSPDRAISTSARLIRQASAIHMVYNMLPSGRTVEYHAKDGENIPSIPAEELSPESAITQATDAIAEEGNGDKNRGDLQVPFVPAARRFYLPQWVSFDDADKLLVGSLQEAEAHVASMQRYVQILHAASSLVPYFIADPEYQKKRYGMLGQLVNQGRAQARYKTSLIIQTIKERASSNSLNRGLSLSLPYFDDQELTFGTTSFEVIPAGRIMFVPAFVVRAAREEIAKRSQDTRFNESTRAHLIHELQMFERAFSASDRI